MNIKEKVHELYWNNDINCARTILICLGKLFNIEYNSQTLLSTIGLHGAGGFRAQCGLVEGGLMFIGIYYSQLGENEETIVSVCYNFAEAFTQRFGSLSCYHLRPNGFTDNDPPHMCENLTCEAVSFAYDFIKNQEATETL